MKILRLILDNLKRGTLTAKFPEKQPVSPNYRGMVSIDYEKCVGCGQCAYSCPSCAMEVHREGDKYQWKYDAGKCTFCGRCIDRCKLHLLTMATERPPVYEHQGDLKQEFNMVRKRPVRPPAPVSKEAAKPETVPAMKAEAAKEEVASAAVVKEAVKEAQIETPPVTSAAAEQTI
jgi:formate hydrogenlyase subunit 6/NADH:ubiquinone oxidoreductase subunit I